MCTTVWRALCIFSIINVRICRAIGLLSHIMKETKKEYQQPEMTVVELDAADLIATSGDGPGEGDAGGGVPGSGPIGF